MHHARKHMHTVITQATLRDAAAIAKLTVALTEEISKKMGARHFSLDTMETTEVCADLLSNGEYSVLLASINHEPIGFVGLSEGYALYAGGAIGTMQEFYVCPAFRSCEVGASLINAAKAYAQKRAWKCMEVCTPPLPEFDRSLRFYERNGFAITGGRKMKLIL